MSFSVVCGSFYVADHIFSVLQQNPILSEQLFMKLVLQVFVFSLIGGLMLWFPVQLEQLRKKIRKTQGSTPVGVLIEL